MAFFLRAMLKYCACNNRLLTSSTSCNSVYVHCYLYPNPSTSIMLRKKVSVIHQKKDHLLWRCHYIYPNPTSTGKNATKNWGGGGLRSDIWSCKNCKFTGTFDVIMKIDLPHDWTKPSLSVYMFPKQFPCSRPSSYLPAFHYFVKTPLTTTND